MPRPNRSDERRVELTPVLAEAFAQLGYAGATTAKLAAHCELAENQLYRLWSSKKAMFLAVIDHLYEQQARWWKEQLEEGDPATVVARILEKEGRERGSTGLHRVLFAGLSATEDEEIRTALKSMYRSFHRFIADLLKQHAKASGGIGLQPELAAWALIGLGTVSNIARELDLFPVSTQRKLMREAGEPLAGI
ncbi:MAG: TetR/AcrR family transcriptional regulator [Algisphaera sp.]